MASSTGGGQKPWKMASTGTAEETQSEQATSPMARAMEVARHQSGLSNNSRKHMVAELKAVELLFTRVKSWDATTTMDEKVRFEIMAGLEMTISKLKLSLHVEDLDSILMKE